MVQNAKEHESLGLKFSEAVKKAIGESFQVGNSAEILYAANGASDGKISGKWIPTKYIKNNFLFQIMLFQLAQDSLTH